MAVQNLLDCITKSKMFIRSYAFSIRWDLIGAGLIFSCRTTTLRRNNVWFDEPIIRSSRWLRPVTKKSATERCYKMVAIASARESFFYAAVKVLPGNVHDLPVLYDYFEQFVQRVPRIMKLLMLDRGFIDEKNESLQARARFDVSFL